MVKAMEQSDAVADATMVMLAVEPEPEPVCTVVGLPITAC